MSKTTMMMISILHTKEKMLVVVVVTARFIKVSQKKKIFSVRSMCAGRHAATFQRFKGV